MGGGELDIQMAVDVGNHAGEKMIRALGDIDQLLGGGPLYAAAVTQALCNLLYRVAIPVGGYKDVPDTQSRMVMTALVSIGQPPAAARHFPDERTRAEGLRALRAAIAYTGPTEFLATVAAVLDHG